MLLLFSVFPATNAISQLPGYPVRKFTVAHGLQYNIVKVAQDAKGFLWIMYPDELQRFDGENAELFFEGETLSSLLVDSRERVWVTTRKGVFEFDTRTRRFVERSGEAGTAWKAVFESEDGKLFCISVHGIRYYDETSKQFVQSAGSSYQVHPEAVVSYRRFSHHNYTLYYCTRDTVWRHQMQTGKKDILAVRDIRNIVSLSEQEIIVNTWEHKSWYYNFSTGQQLRLTVPGTDPFLFVFDKISIDRDRYYLATSKGLAVYDKGANSLQRVSFSLDGVPFFLENCKALCKGNGNVIWAGTPGSLMGFKPFSGNINYIQKKAADPGDWASHSVRNFAEDERGNLWLATLDGVTYWDMEHHRFSTIRAEENATDRLSHASIRGLVYDGTNLIIGQTNKGIWLYNPKTEVFNRPVFANDEKARLLKAEYEGAFIHQIITLKNGNHLIAANEGTYVLNGKDYTIDGVDFPGFGFREKFAYQDSSGTVFIGTSKGLYCLDGSLRYRHKIMNAPWTQSMLEYNDGYYLGTSKGVYFLSNASDTATVKSIIPRLKGHSIRTLFKGDDNTVWVVTEGKLYQYFPKTEALHTYGYSENIRGDFFYPNGYIRKSNGQVFLGAANGVNYFYPEKIDLYPEQLHPYIREVAIREFTDSITDPTAPRRLKRYQNTINIDFSTPYYGNHEDISYKYQLTKNGEWFHHGNRANLTLWKLPPGNYQFRVAATLYDEVWHISESSFRFTILPPFWETWWFRFIVFLSGCFALYSIFMSLRRKLKTEQLLNAFATSLYGHSTVDNILWDMAKNCVEKLGFTHCVIYELDSKKNTLLQKAVAGGKNIHNEVTTARVKITIHEETVIALAASGKSFREKNAKGGDYEIAVPIWIEDEVFGVIDAYYPGRNFYRRYPLRLLDKVSVICGDRLRKYLTQEKLRGEIARDLHDEMGSTLTSIHIISKMAEQDIEDNTPVKKQLSRINDHASGMMEKMSDMVWVVNPANDSLDKLMYRIREYAVEVLEPRQIGLSFKEAEDARKIKLNPEQRKNIYLIAKEALNNAVKYSAASRVGIDFMVENSQLKLHIRDNGKGYKPSVSYDGNGIKNMTVRSEAIDATLQIETAPEKGVSLLLCLSIEKTQPVVGA